MPHWSTNVLTISWKWVTDAGWCSFRNTALSSRVLCCLMPLILNPTLCTQTLLLLSTFCPLLTRFGVWLFLLTFCTQAFLCDREALLNLPLAFLIKAPYSSLQPHKSSLPHSSLSLRLALASTMKLTWIWHNYRDTSIGHFLCASGNVSFLLLENESARILLTRSAKAHFSWDDGFQCSTWFANYSTICKMQSLLYLSHQCRAWMAL